MGINQFVGRFPKALPEGVARRRDAPALGLLVWHGALALFAESTPDYSSVAKERRAACLRKTSCTCSRVRVYGVPARQPYHAFVRFVSFASIMR
jgi:hypothetical protein